MRWLNTLSFLDHLTYALNDQQSDQIGRCLPTGPSKSASYPRNKGVYCGQSESIIVPLGFDLMRMSSYLSEVISRALFNSPVPEAGQIL